MRQRAHRSMEEIGLVHQSDYFGIVQNRKMAQLGEIHQVIGEPQSVVQFQGDEIGGHDLCHGFVLGHCACGGIHGFLILRECKNGRPQLFFEVFTCTSESDRTTRVLPHRGHLRFSLIRLSYSSSDQISSKTFLHFSQRNSYVGMPSPPQVHYLTAILLTTRFTPRTHQASRSAIRFMVSLGTRPSKVMIQSFEYTRILVALTKGFFSKTRRTASVSSSSLSSSGGTSSIPLTTSRHPGTHHARAPARRLCERLGTSPLSVTTPSLTSTTMEPAASGTSRWRVSRPSLTRL